MYQLAQVAYTQQFSEMKLNERSALTSRKLAFSIFCSAIAFAIK
jgi:hypothetical protein